MLLRLACLGITNAFELLRILPRSDRDKDTEILALRHQLMILQRHLDGQRVRFDPADRAWLAALLHHLPPARSTPAAAAGTARHDLALAPWPARPPSRREVAASPAGPAAVIEAVADNRSP
jgi:hypothetical protein